MIWWCEEHDVNFASSVSMVDRQLKIRRQILNDVSKMEFEPRYSLVAVLVELIDCSVHEGDDPVLESRGVNSVDSEVYHQLELVHTQ